MGWTRGPNGLEKSKTAIDIEGLCEDKCCGSRSGSGEHNRVMRVIENWESYPTRYLLP